MIRTTPRLRTTRQRSHIGFTDALTFTLYSRVVSNQLRRRPAGPMNRARGREKTALRPTETGSRALLARRLGTATRSGQVALHRDGLLEGGPVLERRGRDRERGGDHGAVLVIAAGLRVVGAVPVAVERLRGHLERLQQRLPEVLAALGLRAAAAVDPAPCTRWRRAEQVAEILRHVSPPTGEEVGRRRLAAGVVADREQPLRLLKELRPQGRLELGADEQRPPGVHQGDCRSHLVVTVPVQVPAMSAGRAPALEHRDRVAK